MISYRYGPEEMDGRHVEQQPVWRIEPPRHVLELPIRELWQCRDLWWALASRDINVRYKQTILGGLWALLQPLAPALVFVLIFSRIAGLSTDGMPGAIFYLTGLLPWTFFVSIVNGSTQNLLESARLLTKVYFPRILIPAASLGYATMDALLAGIVFSALLIYFGMPITPAIVLAPLAMLGAGVSGLGIGLFMAALAAKYRDFRYIQPFLLQLWFFLTPIVYPAGMISENCGRWGWLANLNPLTGMVNAMRTAIAGTPLDVAAFLMSWLIGILMAIIGVAVFQRIELELADVV